MSNDFFYERWMSFPPSGLVAVNFIVNIMVCYSWIGSFGVRSLNSYKCVARWILCHYCPPRHTHTHTHTHTHSIGYLGKLFGGFEVNFENNGRIEMFSMPGESDLVESCMLGVIVSMFVSSCYLKWIICGGKIISSTKVDNISSRRNRFWSRSAFFKDDFDQETGQEYSIIVQIMVKADRRKAIA